MDIAILGSRGIPARYGGYETLVEELAAGLTESGAFRVTVYCRSAYYPERLRSYRGAYLVYLPSSRMKGGESLIHTFLSTLHVLGTKADLVYLVDPANAPFCFLLRVFGRKVVLHTDGLGWKRQKWGPLARRYYRFVEWLTARTANALVTDSPVMQAYYRQEYNADSFYIAYGAANAYGVDDTIYKEHGLVPFKYLLVVARLEPENNTTLIVEEYVRSGVKIPLVVVGNSPYGPNYMARLRGLASERVLFIGRIDDQAKLNALYRGAYAYIHGHEVGGTNPSLLRAMNAGTAVAVLDVQFNTSVVGEAGFAFAKDRGCLSGLLQRLITFPQEIRDRGVRAQVRVDENFTWEKVVRDHALLFQNVAAGKLERRDQATS